MMDMKEIMKATEIREVLERYLPSEIVEYYSGTTEPVPIIALIEAARVHLHTECLKKLKLAEEGKIEYSHDEYEYDIKRIDEVIKKVYDEVDKIIPIKRLAKKWELI